MPLPQPSGQEVGEETSSGPPNAKAQEGWTKNLPGQELIRSGGWADLAALPCGSFVLYSREEISQAVSQKCSELTN